MVKQSRADYRYRVIPPEPGQLEKMLLIVDLDLGGRSVTNDIENVVADICEREQSDYGDYFLIVYRDSVGRWEEYDPTYQSIRPLSPEARDSIKEYIKVI